MKKDKNRMRTRSGWAGALQKKRSAHETHLGYKSRSIYHEISNLVKPFFGLLPNPRLIDKSGAVPYKVTERSSADLKQALTLGQSADKTAAADRPSSCSGGRTAIDVLAAYAAPLNNARATLADFFTILL
jgi:hypothetical protein